MIQPTCADPGSGLFLNVRAFWKGFTMQVLETERLFIRPFTMEDVEDTCREIYTGTEVWGPKTREQVAEGVMMAMLMSQSHDDAPWAKRAVVLKVDGAFIGQVRLSPSQNYFYRWEEEPDPPYNELEVELAFAFGKQYWGQSYAYEASQAMLRYAFDELDLRRLVNGTGDENLRSINLHRRLGFRIFKALPNNEGIVAVLNNDRH
jgi:ribosomal-protein-alanine N-acetyltransferase